MIKSDPVLSERLKAGRFDKIPILTAKKLHMLIIKYIPDFREDCIGIFRSNLPKYFADEELEQFKNFLDHDIQENYYVVQSEGLIIGCGGIFLDQSNGEAGLSWGMVHADYHRRGIGKFFTQYRIDLLKKLILTQLLKLKPHSIQQIFIKREALKRLILCRIASAKESISIQ